MDTGTVALYQRGADAPLRISVSGRSIILGPAPVIAAVSDVVGDYGGLVRVKWYRSSLDSLNGDSSVTEYSLWRRVEDDSGISITSAKNSVLNPTLRVNHQGQRMINGVLWDFIVTVPAVRFTEYSYVAPTLANVTNNSIPYAVFEVSAQLQNGEFYFSFSDSGYSEDNITPIPPPLAQASIEPADVRVSWSNPNPAPDFFEYRVYRSPYASMNPQAAVRLGTTTHQYFLDSAATKNSTYYYGVTTVNSALYESIPVVTGPFLVTGVKSSKNPVPANYALLANFPNPFNPTTTIQYQLPKVSFVHLSIYNLLGQEVRTLVNGTQKAGYKSVQFTGNDLSSGIYFYHISAGEFSDTKKLVLMK